MLNKRPAHFLRHQSRKIMHLAGNVISHPANFDRNSYSVLSEAITSLSKGSSYSALNKHSGQLAVSTL